MRQRKTDSGGFTIVELIVAIVVLSMIAIALIGLYIALVQSAILSQRKAVALTLATNQIEYLKSLPYNSLAVVGGSIVATNPLPASTTTTQNGIAYTVDTSISYVDDAYDGCGSYPNQTLKQTYCRNYPPPAGAPATDLNPADYKVIDVTVYDVTGQKLAELDTEISARVAETASNTGALFVKVIDGTGSPVSGATVNAVNSSTTPAVNVSDSTDENGEAIFYDLPPSTSGNHYVVTASLSGYSSLTTIAPSGSLQPNYLSQNLFSQQSSNVTLTILPMGTNSLLMQATDTNGNPLTGAKIYVKGGYKKYTSATDFTYYYDNMSPSDSRPTTDASGYATSLNLPPINGYLFCNSDATTNANPASTTTTNCAIGATKYYLAAAVPYGGTTSLGPITIPIDDPSNPPANTYSYGGVSYLQEVQLMLTSSSSFPRVNNLTPSEASQASGTLSSFGFQIAGFNLPCSSTAGSCTTKVKFIQGANSFTASCTGAAAGITLDCTVNLSSAAIGEAQLVVTVGSNTLTLPASPLLGGINVTP